MGLATINNGIRNGVDENIQESLNTLENIFKSILECNENDEYLYKAIGETYDLKISQVNAKIEEFIKILIDKQSKSIEKGEKKSKYDEIIIKFIKFSSINLIPKIMELLNKSDNNFINEMKGKFDKILENPGLSTNAIEKSGIRNLFNK